MRGERADDVIANVGRRIAELRQLRGWTQQDAAERVRMPLKNLQRYEAGTNLTVRTLVRIARGLGVATRALFDDVRAAPKRTPGRPRRGGVPVGG